MPAVSNAGEKTCFTGTGICFVPGCCEKELDGPCLIMSLTCVNKAGAVQMYFRGKLVLDERWHYQTTYEDMEELLRKEEANEKND